MPTAALHMFTKLPGAVRCKTRLAQSAGLGELQTTRLAIAFLNDSLRNAAAALEPDSSKLQLHTHPKTSCDALAQLLRTVPCALEESITAEITLHEQTGDDFSERFDNAVFYAESESSTGVVFLGSDAPLLSPNIIKRALKLVAAGHYVLGPTAGGGLYLIGIPQRKEAMQFSFRRVFEAQEMSEIVAFEREISAQEIPLVLLEPHFDIDKLDDLITASAIIAVENSASREKTADSEQHYGDAPSTTAIIAELQWIVTKELADNRAVGLRGAKPS